MFIYLTFALKKITAIFFLIIFAFNWFGYRLMYDFMKTQANKQLEVALDNNHYDESQLIELKVPVNLPYQTSWSSYQRYDGEIEIGGVKYKYVKRKLANDTLYLKCIPNTKEMKLQTAKNDFFKLTNDLAQNQNPKKADNSSISVLKYLSVFDNSSFGIEINSPLTPDQQWLSLKAEALPFVVLLSSERPPDYNA
ncbi:hypothetical protein EFY79_19615 [Hanamia caeni]|uniref:Uncharacterized protein n=1 Tax=Hanamia caeni TaxID=2294116 RepID=A0A3M9N4R7_9BACT|nr:hypothetical protein EFY79_19615 [Hanamia caeni]